MGRHSRTFLSGTTPLTASYALVWVWVAVAIAGIGWVSASDIELASATPKKEEREAPKEKIQAKPVAMPARWRNCDRVADAHDPNGARLVSYCIAKKRHQWYGGELVGLNNLWTWESGFDYLADNPTSAALGIPQCMTNLHLPCDTERYRKDPVYQIIWGLAYIDVRYDFPSVAWAKHQERCPSYLGCWY